jgi:hypothetical protein
MSKLTAPPPAEKGGLREVIGRSRGGRTTAIQALTDAIGRPLVLLIAPGRLIADNAYDTNRLRSLLAQQGIEAVIPSITRRDPA